MKAGPLKHRVTIQSPSGSQNNFGEVSVDDWEDVETRWASVEPLSGRELEYARQTYADVTHRIRLRDINLTPRQRLVFKGRVFNVLSALNPQERNIETIVMAKEAV